LNDLGKLANLLRQDRSHLLAQWRRQVRELPSAQHLDTPTLNDHVPELIEELATALEVGSDETIAASVDCQSSPPVHGLQRVEDGFDIAEVVAEYNILRGCIHDLASGHEINLRGRPFHILNRVLDGAIGLAVQTYAAQRALDVQRRREEYLGFVAHDLRTPLNAIWTAAKLLEQQLPGEGVGGDTAKALKILSRNTAHLGELISEVLKESANVEAGPGIKLERRRFDLWPLVEGLIYELNPIADTDGARLINEIPDDLAVHADAGLLSRIFQNLIANAIVHAPRGKIVIGARQTDAKGAVECSIRDNGAGIPPERLRIIFEKFESDHQADNATGLGLAIVKSFVEAHGGSIEVESRPGAGSVFRFTLPGPDPHAAPDA
jgi:signal transduction histidine kinase